MRFNLNPGPAAACITIFYCVCYLLLAGTTIEMTTIQYDEFTDLMIASELRHHPLSGSSLDGSQARFPMYVTAVASFLFQKVNPAHNLFDLLLVSRWISILMSMAAICGTVYLGKELFNLRVGLLAGGLMASSPFFLHFGKDALTQGDTFTTAPVVFALIALWRFDRQRSTFWLAVFSISLALAFASKFFLVILVPASLAYVVLAIKLDFLKPSPETWKGAPDIRPFLVSSIGAGVLALIAFLAAVQGNLGRQLPRLLWGASLVCIAFCIYIAIRDLRIRLKSHADTSPSWTYALAGVSATALSFGAMMALFPSHIFNPHILPVLSERAITLDGSTSLFGETVNSLRLYLGLFLFKTGLPLGILTLLSFAWGLRNAFVDKGVLLLIVVILSYGLLLSILPLQQPFWLMSVYPLIIILLSAMFVGIYGQLERPLFKRIWGGGMLAAVLWLFVGLFNVYPTYALYGYEMLGDTWLGKDSRGYREVVVVTNDGSTEAFDWLRKNAPRGSSVMSYLNDVHLSKYLGEVQPFPFQLEEAVRYADQDRVIDDLLKADYVVVRVVDDIGIAAPVQEAFFKEKFEDQPVFEVIRGRGIYRMPIIQIFERMPEAGQVE